MEAALAQDLQDDSATSKIELNLSTGAIIDPGGAQVPFQIQRQEQALIWMEGKEQSSTSSAFHFKHHLLGEACPFCRASASLSLLNQNSSHLKTHSQALQSGLWPNIQAPVAQSSRLDKVIIPRLSMANRGFHWQLFILALVIPKSPLRPLATMLGKSFSCPAWTLPDHSKNSEAIPCTKCPVSTQVLATQLKDKRDNDRPLPSESLALLPESLIIPPLSRRSHSLNLVFNHSLPLCFSAKD